MKRTTTTYQLPSGKTTRSIFRYLREWNGLAQPVDRALGCYIIATDPGLYLCVRGASMGFVLPVSVAQRILELVKVEEALLGEMP